MTPLHWAADKGHDAMARLLLHAGADGQRKNMVRVGGWLLKVFVWADRAGLGGREGSQGGDGGDRRGDVVWRDEGEVGEGEERALLNRNTC